MENAIANNICLPQTIALNTDNSISVVDVSGTLSVSWMEMITNVYKFPNAKKIIVGTKVNKLYGHPAANTKELILPNTLTAVAYSSAMFKN